MILDLSQVCGFFFFDSCNIYILQYIYAYMFIHMYFLKQFSKSIKCILFCYSWPFGIRKLNWGSFPQENYFSHIQSSSIAYNSLSRFEALTVSPSLTGLLVTFLFRSLLAAIVMRLHGYCFSEHFYDTQSCSILTMSLGLKIFLLLFLNDTWALTVTIVL